MKEQVFIRLLSEQLNLNEIPNLKEAAEGLRDNGINTIEAFVDAATATATATDKQDKRPDVLFLDLARSGVVVKDGCIQLTAASQPSSDFKTPLSQNKLCKSKLKEIAAAAGGNEALAISIYRCVMGQNGEEVFYNDSHGESHATGYFVFSSLVGFLVCIAAQAEFQQPPLLFENLIRRKVGSEDTWLFEISQRMPLACNPSSVGLYNIVIEAKLQTNDEGKNIGIAISIKKIDLDLPLESDSTQLEALIAGLGMIAAFDGGRKILEQLSIITLQEKELKIKKGGADFERYAILGKNSTAVSEVLSKFVDVLPKLNEKVITKLITALLSCDDKVLNSLADALCSCCKWYQVPEEQNFIFAVVGQSEYPKKVAEFFVPAAGIETRINVAALMQFTPQNVAMYLEGRKKIFDFGRKQRNCEIRNAMQDKRAATGGIPQKAGLPGSGSAARVLTATGWDSGIELQPYEPPAIPDTMSAPVAPGLSR